MKMYYELNEDGSIGQSTNSKALALKLGLTLETEREFAFGCDGKRHFADELPVPPTTFNDYDRAMEAHLDAEKAARGYTKREPSDYKDSSNPRWAQDAEDWIAHRDEVMEYGLEVENKAKRGEPVPTLEEFKAGLPNIVWTYPDEDGGADE